MMIPVVFNQKLENPENITEITVPFKIAISYSPLNLTIIYSKDIKLIVDAIFRRSILKCSFWNIREDIKKILYEDRLILKEY